MKNIFTYHPHKKLFHIHLGVKGQLGYSIVDKEGFDIASSYSGTWSNARGYAIISTNKVNKQLHRLIIAAPWEYDVDHINANSLDNRKCNLQVVTPSQNQAKTKISSANTSGYKGVFFHLAAKKWQAQISLDGKHKSLDLFWTKEEAALAYNKRAKEVFGTFAYQNTIKPNILLNRQPLDCPIA